MGFKLATVFVDVVANKDAFERSISDMKRELDRLSRQVKIDVRVDTRQAERDIARLKQQIRELGGVAVAVQAVPTAAPPNVPPRPSGRAHPAGTAPPAPQVQVAGGGLDAALRAQVAATQRSARATQEYATATERAAAAMNALASFIESRIPFGRPGPGGPRGFVMYPWRPRAPRTLGPSPPAGYLPAPPTGFEHRPAYPIEPWQRAIEHQVAGYLPGPRPEWQRAPSVSRGLAAMGGGPGGGGTSGGGGRRGGGGVGGGGGFTGFGPRSGRNRLGRGMFFQGVSPAEFAVGALQIGAGILGARAGLALLTAPAQMMREYMAFEEAATSTRILLKNMGESRAAIESAEKAARRFGETTIFTARESAEQLQVLARRGYNAADAIQILGASADLAAATGTNLSNAVQTSSQVLKAFAKDASDASRVADILTQATNTTALGIDDLSAALKFAGPSAHLLGINIKDTTAALAAMVERGITPNIAGRGLRSVFMQLSRPTVQQAFEQIGVPITDRSGNFRGMLAILRDFNRATASMTGPQRLAFLVQHLGRQAASAFATLASGVDTLEDVSQTLDQSFGKAADQAAERLGTLSARWKLLTSAMSEFAITSAGKVRPGAAFLLDLLTGITRGAANAINRMFAWTQVFYQSADATDRLSEAIRRLNEQTDQLRRSAPGEMTREIASSVMEILTVYLALRGLGAGFRAGGFAMRRAGRATMAEYGVRFRDPTLGRTYAPRTTAEIGVYGLVAFHFAEILKSVGGNLAKFGVMLGRLSIVGAALYAAFRAVQWAVEKFAGQMLEAAEQRRYALDALKIAREEAIKRAEKERGKPWSKFSLAERAQVFEDVANQWQEENAEVAKWFRRQAEMIRRQLTPTGSAEGAGMAIDELLDALDPSRVRRRRLREKFDEAEAAIEAAKKFGVPEEQVKKAQKTLMDLRQKYLRQREKEEEPRGAPSFLSGLGLWRKIQMELLQKDRAEDQRDEMIRLLAEIRDKLMPAEAQTKGLSPQGAKQAVEAAKAAIENIAPPKSFWGWLGEFISNLLRRPIGPQGGTREEMEGRRAQFGNESATDFIGGRGFQSGGLVRGPRSPADSVPALLTGGEVILNKQQQMRLALMAGTSPAALFRMAGVPGFQGGGLVPSSDPFDQFVEDYIENFRRSRQTHRSFPGLNPHAARPDAGLAERYWQEAQQLLEDISHPRTTASGRAHRRVTEGRSGFTASAPRYGAADETSPLGRGIYGGDGRRPSPPSPASRGSVPKPHGRTLHEVLEDAWRRGVYHYERDVIFPPPPARGRAPVVVHHPPLPIEQERSLQRARARLRQRAATGDTSVRAGSYRFPLDLYEFLEKAPEEQRKLFRDFFQKVFEEIRNNPSAYPEFRHSESDDLWYMGDQELEEWIYQNLFLPKYGFRPVAKLSPSPEVRARIEAGRAWNRQWRAMGLPQYMLTRPRKTQLRYKAAWEQRQAWGAAGIALPKLPRTPADLPPELREQFNNEMAAYIDHLVTDYQQSLQRGVTPQGPNFMHPGAQAGARAAAWHRRRRQMHEARRREWRLRKKAEGTWIGQHRSPRWRWTPIFVNERDHLSPREQYQQMVESLSARTSGATLPVFVTNLDGLLSVGYRQITAIKSIGGFVHVVD